MGDQWGQIRSREGGEAGDQEITKKGEVPRAGDNVEKRWPALWESWCGVEGSCVVG